MYSLKIFSGHMLYGASSISQIHLNTFYDDSIDKNPVALLFRLRRASIVRNESRADLTPIHTEGEAMVEGEPCVCGEERLCSPHELRRWFPETLTSASRHPHSIPAR